MIQENVNDDSLEKTVGGGLARMRFQAPCFSQLPKKEKWITEKIEKRLPVLPVGHPDEKGRCPIGPAAPHQKAGQVDSRLEILANLNDDRSCGIACCTTCKEAVAATEEHHLFHHLDDPPACGGSLRVAIDQG
jgi:hypothetical protein